MSIDLCTVCNELVDTDEDTNCYIGDTCMCETCQQLYPGKVYAAELERDMRGEP